MSVSVMTSRLSQRVICLIDMDCFYVQVEELAAPEFRGKPCGVSQYNPYRGGGLIAVNYEARKFNVKRGMRGEDAKALCPEFHIFYVNEKRGKADLTKYRDASLKIFEIISKHCSSVEKASIDEAYIDLTDQAIERIRSNKITKLNYTDLNSSFVVGSYSLENSSDRETNIKAWLEPISNLSNESSDTLLAVGAVIVEEIRADILNTLGYHCSAGVAHNKTLAKLCCGLNKPNKQTILPLSAVEEHLNKTPIKKIKNLGGKLGVILNEEMKLNTVGDLAKIEIGDLIKKFGEKSGNWLHQISHGIDLEPVMSRQAPKSIGCSKNFRGNQALNTVKKVNYWINQLSEELEERLISDKERNQREAKLLVIHITTEAGSFSKSTAITKYCAKRFAEQSIELIQAFNKAAKNRKAEIWQPVIFTLGVSATKFVESDKSKSANPLLKYFSTNSKTAKENEDSNRSKKNISNDDSLSNDANMVDESLTKSNELNEDDETNLSYELNKQCEHNLSDSNSNINKKDNSSSCRSDSEKLSREIDELKENIEINFSNNPTTSKQSNETKDESILDADSNFDYPDDQIEEEDLILIDHVVTKKDGNSSKNNLNKSSKQNTHSKLPAKPLNKSNIFKSFPKQKATDDSAKSNYQDVDYVKCEKCNKNILCWEMPEHQDFHYALELSKQMSSSNTASVNSNENSNSSNDSNRKKRSLEETPNKSGNSNMEKTQKENSKDLINFKGKKVKQEQQPNSKKSTNIKPIDNYFKKINKDN